MFIVKLAFIPAFFAFAVFFSVFLFSDFRREHEFATKHIMCGILVAIVTVIAIATETATVFLLLFPIAIWEMIVTIIQIKDSYNPYMRKKYLLEQIKDLQNKLSESHEEERKLMCEIDNLQAENEELRKKLRERPPITSNEHVRNVYDKKIAGFKIDLNNANSNIQRYKKLIEHCIVLHPDLNNSLPTISDPDFDNTAFSFLQIINKRREELKQIEQSILAQKEKLKILHSIPEEAKTIAPMFYKAFRKKYVGNKYIEGITKYRLNNAFELKEIDISNLQLSVSAKIHSRNETYTTTLESCSCPDAKNHKTFMCKHSILLAYCLGLLQFNNYELQQCTNDVYSKLKDAAENLDTVKKEFKEAEKEKKRTEKKIEDYQKRYPELFNKKKKSHNIEVEENSEQLSLEQPALLGR